MITDRLIERIIELQNPTCVGLDTSFDYLPDDMRAGAKNFPTLRSAFSISIKSSSTRFTTSFRP